MFENDEEIERFRFSFLYEPNKNLMGKLDKLTIDKRIFYYLLKKVITIKINKTGIFTREFYSEDMTKVFMVLKCQENTLRKRAAVRPKDE